MCKRKQEQICHVSYLVQVGVFKKITMSYLPVGHTHADIDALFGNLSTAFKSYDAVNISKLHEVISDFLNESLLHIEQIRWMPNITDYFDKNGLLNTMVGHSKIGSFQFEMFEESVGIKWKLRMSDENWMCIQNKPFILLKNNTDLINSQIGNISYKVLDPKMIDQMRICIKAAKHRIHDKRDYRLLKEELQWLIQPSADDCAWDTTIYARFEQLIQRRSNSKTTRPDIITECNLSENNSNDFEEDVNGSSENESETTEEFNEESDIESEESSKSDEGKTVDESHSSESEDGNILEDETKKQCFLTETTSKQRLMLSSELCLGKGMFVACKCSNLIDFNDQETLAHLLELERLFQKLHQNSKFIGMTSNQTKELTIMG